MSSLLRSLLLVNKSARAGQAGFVLPTTVLLLLVMTLTVGALSFRTASRTQSTFLAREQQVIDNVAAPAVDRGKTKLEYLFGKDTRIPGTTTPSSDVLSTLMRNVTESALDITGLTVDPYTLPDETRIDINNDGVLDNAWSFSFDLNGDGSSEPDEIIAYSLLMDDSVDPAAIDNNDSTTATATRDDDIKLEDTGTGAAERKADNLVTRNGPINTSNVAATCGARIPAQGWLAASPATLEKNFQITAFVSNGKDPGRTNSALELQQVRIAQQGNIWGAWFRYDMELNPGASFNWNGAMHTEGNLYVTNLFNAHMISSHNSCLYDTTASNITLGQADNDGNGVNVTAPSSRDFQGQLISGALINATVADEGTSQFHIFDGLGRIPVIGTRLKNTNDSVENANFADAVNIALDPVILFAQNISRHRLNGPGTWQRATSWATNTFNIGTTRGRQGRVTNQNQTQPFLDDFYRADNRYGPVPNYATYNWVTATEEGGDINLNRDEVGYDKQLGDEIIDSDPRAETLINATEGLDGYWERKAITNGMRVVIGQRLELGDHLGWNFDADGDGLGDPLYPPQLNGMSNKQRQRVTLKDNLAAVQGMVVYHYGSNNGHYPLACIANTAHPGTIQTLSNSRTFNNYSETGAVKTDFLKGNGTNGWEFSFPAAFDTEAEFGAALASNQPLGIALRNLAYFAGDPNGGSPSFTPRQNATVHPFPHQAMWGDFSILRRIFDERLDATSAKTATANTPAIPAWRTSLSSMADRYDALSPADKSSLHSAACTQGLLAYSLNTLELEAKRIMAKYLSDMVAAAYFPLGRPALPLTATPIQNMPTMRARLNELKSRAGSSRPLKSMSDSERDILELYRQVERDRQAGFLKDSSLPILTPSLTPPACSRDDFSDVPSASGTDLDALALVFCSRAANETSKYPSLYYLFPKITHGQTGDIPYVQPSAEEYINQAYLTNATSGVNRAGVVTYSVVGDFAPLGIENASDASIAAIAFTPRANDGSNWVLPTNSIGAGAGTLNPESMNIRMPNGGRLSLSLIDKVMYNGREEMAVRVLDVDLGRLTQTTTVGGDYWISNNRPTINGIFYA
ncbi:MAG: hypothetical protein WBA76_17685, partial [Phormidesmis sp.]